MKRVRVRLQEWGARAGAWLRAARPPAATGAARTVATPTAPGHAAAIAIAHGLDREIGQRLEQAVDHTERSALAIMGQVRGLCEQSQQLSQELAQATLDADSAEQAIAQEVDELARMAQFLSALPARLESDLGQIGRVAAEIASLADLVDVMRTVSMQSHLLSINAAIEASRAGASGAAFKVVAQEMRTLAADSGDAARRIAGSLERAHQLLQKDLSLGQGDATQQFRDIAASAATVERLQRGIANAALGYRGRFAQFSEHGAMVALGAGEVLGQLQYQDIVRQGVERAIEAMTQRNAAFAQEFDGIAPPGPEALAGMVQEVLDRYLIREAMHGHNKEAEAAPSIELF